MSYIALEPPDLIIAAALVLINGALSLALRLGPVRQLAIAAARMVVQLLLVGLVLTTLFELVSPWWTGLAALIMFTVAGREIMAHQDRRLARLWSYGLGTGCMLLAVAIVTVFALNTQIRPDPWFHPQFTLPILGMIIGNIMTVIALALDTLSTGLASERASVEAQQALGATRAHATRPIARTALRAALIPIINTMAAAGIVTLPGMMKGQILAGIDPVEAVKYQILIMFLIAGGTGLGAMVAIYGGVWRLTDARHHLRLDRLVQP